MRWDKWKRWIWRRSDDDFAAEVESHIAMEVERLVASGMSEEDARFAARRAFGNPTTTRERFHDSRPWRRLDSLEQDVRYALRTMRRAPGFTAIAVASLAIGIGANTTMFSAIDTLLLRTPAHVRDADRIHRLYFQTPGSRGESYTGSVEGYRTYSEIRDRVPDFEATAAFAQHKVSSGRGPDARSIDAVLATSNLFTMLGVRPELGRFFAPREDRADGDRVAVLGYETWRGQYGGDSAVLGRTIDVQGVPYTIVGIAPSGFTGVNLDRVDLWLPLGAAVQFFGSNALSLTSGGYWLEIVAKRRSTAPAARVASEVTQVYRDLGRDRPRFEETFGKAVGILGPISAGRGPAANGDARVSLWVAAVSLLVLVIASANVANLLLLRGLTRSREVALRLSLGATRWRVMQHSLVEGALLAVFGAMAAMVLARWSASTIRTFLLPKAANQSVFDFRLLAFTAVVALATGVLASIIPALASARRDFGPLLGGSRATGGPHRLLLQRMLIGGQVALATLLLVGAGLFVVSLRNVQAIDLGVDTDHVLYVNVDFGRASRRDANALASVNAAYAGMLESVRRVPGVVGATVTAGEPLASGSAIAVRRRGGAALVEGSRVPFMRGVGASYFETMGTPLVRGRYFTAADHVAGAHVAIVDESTAKQYLPDGNGLDPCVYLGGDSACTEVVGVVKNTVLWEMTGDKGTVVYLPFESWGDMAVTMMEVRTAGDPSAAIPAIRKAIQAVSPNLPWVDVRPVSERLDPQLRPWRLGASMFTAFGVLALCLAAVGLYGLLSYVVTQRAQEIGIRKALGAPSGDMIQMVLRSALGMTLAGIAIGIVLALATGRLIASQLYGVSPRSPGVILVCTVTLVAVAIAACLAPARRAASVDPMVALRAE